MRTRTLQIGLAAAFLAACAASHPRTYGQYNDLGPRVTPQQGERLPQHVTIQLSRPANVAVFMVVPGRGSQLLFPADSTQSGQVEAGSHLVTTSVARFAPSDSARLAARRNQPPAGTRPTSGRNGPGGRVPALPRDTSLALATRGYLLVYASQEPLPYSALATRVSGISIPIEDNDALNTVTKLIRQATHTTGPWAAYATDFPP